MADKPCWETLHVDCPEEGRKAELLIEWNPADGKPVLKSITCDNPRLKDIDNWDCKWSCWEKIQKDLEGGAAKTSQA